jgi:uncharacterized PurR-regulated membrane protein YhhQ (DUF165 family)
VDDGPYRLRGATDATWHTSHGYGQRTGILQKLGEGFRAVLRMILPVLGLCAALAGLFLYMDTTLPYFADGAARWLTVSHLLLPAAFFTVHLTNRRYGPAYAFAQIVLSFAVLTAVVMFAGQIVTLFLPEAVFPSVRLVLSFIGAFFVSGFLAIVAFDGARGPRWWTAPFVGSTVAAFAFPPIFYTAAYVGSGEPWFLHLSIHAGLLIGGAVVTLVPFYLVRRIVQPLPGFGGF